MAKDIKGDHLQIARQEFLRKKISQGAVAENVVNMYRQEYTSSSNTM